MSLRKRIIILILYLIIGVTSLYFLWNYINTLPPDVVMDQEEENISDPKVERINEIIANMDDRAKAAQLLIVNENSENLFEIIQEYQLGGLLISETMIQNQTNESIKEEISNFQLSSNIPMLISTNIEESSTELLYTSEEEPFIQDADLYLEGGLEAIRAQVLERSQSLKALGVNFNLGPVADVAVNPYSYIFEETLKLPIETSLEEAATITGDYVTTVVEAQQAEGIGSCLLHFPGYGENDDPTVEPIHDYKDLETFESVDFIPFKEGIAAGAESIMISNNIIDSVDPALPASLSALVHKKLRDDLNFSGVIVAGNFSEINLEGFVDSEEIVIKTVNAGTDMIITKDPVGEINKILTALEDGSLSKERFEEAVFHNLSLKYDLGLL